MKRLLLAGIVFWGLLESVLDAGATMFAFAYSGTAVDFTIQTTDEYQILAFGAQGGSGTFPGGAVRGGRCGVR